VQQPHRRGVSRVVDEVLHLVRVIAQIIEIVVAERSHPYFRSSTRSESIDAQRELTPVNSKDSVVPLDALAPEER